MRTLADMTTQERAESVGMWCDCEETGAPCVLVSIEHGNAVLMTEELGGRPILDPYELHLVTPRFDLPRAWQPDGTPPEGEWEYAEHLSKGVTTVYLCGKENPTHRQWIGKWEEV